MTDKELIADALQKTSLIISEYLEPGERDAKKTLDALIPILDDKALSESRRPTEQTSVRFDC